MLALNKRWLGPRTKYFEWAKDNKTSLINYTHGTSPLLSPFKQGQIQLVKVDRDLWVCNLIGQSGCGRYQGLAPVRYGSIHEGLLRLREVWQNDALQYGEKFSIHMPRMGCGLAGGNWDEIQKMLYHVFYNEDISLTVYDYKG